MTIELSELTDDPSVESGLTRESFYVKGIELIVAEECPFCDTPWDPDDLRAYVQAKVDHYNEVSKKRAAAEKKIAPLIETLLGVQSGISATVRYAALASPPITMPAASAQITISAEMAGTLTNFLPLAGTITALEKIPTVDEALFDDIDNFEKTVSALPEPTKHDAARDWLTVAQERLEVWRDAMRNQHVAKNQAQMARMVSDIYVASSDRVLAGIYSDVEKDFADIYGFVNRDDEDAFEAKLVPSMGKLGFDVDFYGRGFFPPGAYHSEGHQDCMGFCLYLALMRHLQGGAFTFAVLDDVLMSVDAGHRREICALLKTQFPTTQFIMTTHDPIWLRLMRTEKLIRGRSAVQFKGWSVEHGPTQWDDRDVWEEIGDSLSEDNVRAAAALLRHYLEYVSAELCHRLRAPVSFRSDAQYQLGELLPAAVKHLRKLYGRAKAAANSWNQSEVMKEAAGRESKFTEVAEASKVEQWQMNVAVHFNAWENLVKEDFAPVVKAFRDLLGGFACSDCNEYFRVSPERETPESLRCGCGKTNINLRDKDG